MRFLRTDSIHRWTEGDYTVTTDPAVVDIDMVYAFLVEEAYWWHGRPREVVEHAIASSRPYRCSTTRPEAGRLRAVITDGCWFGWIGDVMVVPAHRGGRGKFLMRCVMDDLEPVRRVTLGTATRTVSTRSSASRPCSIRSRGWSAPVPSRRDDSLRRPVPSARTPGRDPAHPLFPPCARDLGDQELEHLRLLRAGARGVSSSNVRLRGGRCLRFTRAVGCHTRPVPSSCERNPRRSS